MTEFVKLSIEDKSRYLEQAVKKYWQQLYNYVNKNIRNYGNSDDAEDITQETFIKLYRNLDKLVNTNIQAWLYKVITNLIRDEYRYRKTKRRNEIKLRDEDLDYENSDYDFDNGNHNRSVENIRTKNKQLDEIMYEELCKETDKLLPEKFKPVARILMSNPDLTYDEFAEKLKIPKGTVKTRIFRIRERLKKSPKFAEIIRRN